MSYGTAMDTIRASSKGQIVIPKGVRDALDIRRGTELNIELMPGEGFKVTVRTTDHAAQVAELAGSLASSRDSKAPLPDDDAVLLAVGRDDRRIRRYARNARRARR